MVSKNLFFGKDALKRELIKRKKKPSYSQTATTRRMKKQNPPVATYKKTYSDRTGHWTIREYVKGRKSKVVYTTDGGEDGRERLAELRAAAKDNTSSRMTYYRMAGGNVYDINGMKRVFQGVLPTPVTRGMLGISSITKSEYDKEKSKSNPAGGNFRKPYIKEGVNAVLQEAIKLLRKHSPIVTVKEAGNTVGGRQKYTEREVPLFTSWYIGNFERWGDDRRWTIQDLTAGYNEKRKYIDRDKVETLWSAESSGMTMAEAKKALGVVKKLVAKKGNKNNPAGGTVHGDYSHGDSYADQIGSIVKDINKARLASKGKWWTYNKNGIQIKGYGTWMQKFMIHGYNNANAMQQSVADFKDHIKYSLQTGLAKGRDDAFYDEFTQSNPAQTNKNFNSFRLYKGRDANGNTTVVIRSQDGGFSIQTNQNLPTLHRGMRGLRDGDRIPNTPGRVNRDFRGYIEEIQTYVWEYGTNRQSLIMDTTQSNPKKGGRTMARRKRKFTAKQRAAAMKNLRKAWAANRKGKKRTTKKRKAKRRTTKKRVVRKTVKRKSAPKAPKGKRKGSHFKRKNRWYVVGANRTVRKSSASAANRAKKRK